ncbi:MAG: ATP-dependent helicase [Clostridiaceae bacterium]|jgi:DNA helicase-2/ATP-dependent DNA helicase PcrA|nr:ATP-dependent helicase [Clostridiaceae bacterium]
MSTDKSILNENNRIDIYKLTNNLDDDQVEAVLAEDSDTCVNAGAGSGKTRVLTHRVAQLISKGVQENNIMLLTFTKKAGNEMIERVKELLQKEKVGVLAGTFHHIAGLFLRKYAQVIGFGRNYSILTPDDAKSLITECRNKYLKEHSIKKSEFPETKIIYAFYSSAINLDKSYDQLNRDERNFTKEVMSGIEEIIEEYKKKKKDSNAMDFDDLLVNFKEILLIDNIRKRINSQFKYVLCDEFQDTNHLQYEILCLLNKGNHTLFAVGDPNQAIYSWRGSNVSYIEDFHRNFKNNQKFNITYNYRSDAYILKLAEDSINRNYICSINKTKITPYLKAKNKPTFFKAFDDIEQAEYIVKKIKSHIKDGMTYKDIAILIRANYLTRILEKTFRKYAIPYKLLSGFSFFERKHIKDLLSFLTFIENPQDESAFLRMFGMFDGLGEKTIEKIFNHYKSSDYDINSLDINKVKLTSRAIPGFNMVVELLRDIYANKTDIHAMLSTILFKFYDDYLKRTEEDYSDRMKDIEYLVSISKQYEDLTLFLSEMILDEQEVNESEEEDDNKVVISTIHKAKGLEWDCVFMPYLNDEVFPSSRSILPEDLKEERRLFYVGVTRARKYLHMSDIGFMTQMYKSLSTSLFLDELSDGLFVIDSCV